MKPELSIDPRIIQLLKKGLVVAAVAALLYLFYRSIRQGPGQKKSWG